MAGASSAAKNAKGAKAMKLSGVEWLGDIPKGWKVSFLSQVASQVKKRNDGLKEKNLLSLSYGKIKRKPIDTIGGLLPANFDGYNIIEANDIVLRLTDLQNDQHSLRVGLACERGIITSAYTTLRPSEGTDARCLFYLLYAFDIRKGFYGMGAGVRQGLKYDEVKVLPIPLPPLPEQRAIADYLDAKCGAIDAAIAEAKKGIEKYKAWKKSLIFEVVTGKKRVGVFNAEKQSRGEAEKMKPSGIPWIGDVPEGWEVMKLRRLGTFANGISKGGEFFGKGSPFVSYSDVYKNEALPITVKGLLLSTPEEQERYSVRTGDVFFTRTSETVDEIGFASTCLQSIAQATFAGFLIRFRPTGHEILPCFSKYYFRNKLVSEYFAKELVMVTRASLGQELLKSLPVLLPSLPEQQAIADYLDERCAAIDAMVAEKEALIADLEAYKKSLIYEVVTGKREVA